MISKIVNCLLEDSLLLNKIGSTIGTHEVPGSLRVNVRRWITVLNLVRSSLSLSLSLWYTIFIFSYSDVIWCTVIVNESLSKWKKKWRRIDDFMSCRRGSAMYFEKNCFGICVPLYFFFFDVLELIFIREGVM